MLQKTLGIVLHTLKYKDTSLIADIYTEVAGRASFMVSIPRSRKAAVKPVLFQPLALVELEADFRPNATIYKVKEAKSLYPFATLPYDPYKSAIALFLSEFLYRAVREEAENRPLFAYLYHSVIWLDECREGFANFHLVFLMRLSPFSRFVSQPGGLSCRRLLRFAECLFHSLASAAPFQLHRSRGGGPPDTADAHEL